MKKTHRTVRLSGGRRIAFLNTSGYPDKEVLKLVRFALEGLDVDRTAVHIKKFGRGSHRGFAYYMVPSISSAPSWCRSLITVRVGGWFGGWREDLVSTTAHEGKHIDYWRVYRRSSGEARARAHERWVLDRYRNSLDNPR